MSDDSDQEKTEQPTEKKLRESREKGEVPRSRDLSGALVVLAGVAALMNSGQSALEHARRIFALGLGYSRDALFTDALAGSALHAAMHEALQLFAPVAIATLLAALAGPLLLGGLNFSTEALQPKFERLDPIKGLGKIFALRGLVELGKALVAQGKRDVRVATILCDTGFRYLSTLYNREWLETKGLPVFDWLK